MQSFTVLCDKLHTILCKKIATINSNLKIDINCKVFSTKLYAHKMFGSRSREFRTIFRAASQSICGLLD